jgi:hypothetical protein
MKLSGPMLRLSGLLLVLLLALVYLTNQRRIADTREGLALGKEDLLVTFDALKPDMSEAELRATVPRPQLQCIDEHRPGFRLGDRVCYAYVRHYLGVRTMMVAYFFRHGMLSSAKIDLPWWSHGAMADALRAQYGPPTGAQMWFREGVRLEGWQRPNGALFYNRDRAFSPLQWSSLYWMSPREMQFTGGGFRHRLPPPPP